MLHTLSEVKRFIGERKYLKRLRFLGPFLFRRYLINRHGQ